MTPVADLSPGTRLKAGTSGWLYTVTVNDDADDTVVARGPRGPLRVDEDELQQNIADGRVEVLN